MLFASMNKSSLKCTSIYAADIKSTDQDRYSESKLQSLSADFVAAIKETP